MPCLLRDMQWYYSEAGQQGTWGGGDSRYWRVWLPQGAMQEQTGAITSTWWKHVWHYERIDCYEIIRPFRTWIKYCFEGVLMRDLLLSFGSTKWLIFVDSVRNWSLYHALVTNQDYSKCQMCHSPVLPFCLSVLFSHEIWNYCICNFNCCLRLKFDELLWSLTHVCSLNWSSFGPC